MFIAGYEIHIFYRLQLQLCDGSYLGIPRLTFTGHVRIDISSVNNFICNFDLEEPIKYGEQFNDFNPKGTGEFSFFDCFVTSALSSNAVPSITDAVINDKVVNNLNETYPKLVDIDVGYQTATVYGLTLAIVNSAGNIVLQGRMEPMMISQDIWARTVCVSRELAELGGQSVSFLTNVKWGDTSGSPTLQDLQVESAKQGGNLSISLTIHSFTSDSESRNFTLGYVIGAIGIADKDEPLQFAGDRILSYENVEQPDIQMHSSDECFHYRSRSYDHPTWMYKAPFQIRHDNRLTVDFSNAISLNEYGSFKDLGDLWLGVKDLLNDCVHLIGDRIPYLQAGWVPGGCIVDRILSTDELHLLSSLHLIVVRTADDPQLLTFTTDHKTISPLPLVSCENKNTFLQLMLQEVPVFIRPIDFYHGRLEYNETISIRIKVTQYGKPMENQTVQVHHRRRRATLPRRGIVPMSYYATTNSQGLATFIFQAVKRIPFPRRYSQPVPPCNKTELPIDGQLYLFRYSVSGKPLVLSANNRTYLTYINDIALVAFSYHVQPDEPTWINDVEPIFRQYERMFPVMRGIVRLGSYNDVTAPHNIRLINYSMSLDIKHPGYMPVSRNLSPSKRTMILKWINQMPRPKYSSEIMEAPSAGICSNTEIVHSPNYWKQHFHPERCHACPIEPELSDMYFQHLFAKEDLSSVCRPLFGYSRSNNKRETGMCSLQTLRTQLQLAIELEFYIIPVYLTSMWSIVEGYNQDIHHKIHSVVVQEMQHVAQVANILIAIGGRPVLDSNTTAPKYPKVGLPGGVLPNLHVNIEKFSKEQVYQLFMAIEMPHNLSVATHSPMMFNDTIGQFYTEIKDCIELLGDSIFIPNTTDKQLMWPSVNTVIDTLTANTAIDVIMHQGEGAAPIDPRQASNGSLHELAHFYEFEEIVCQRHLISNDQTTYCYSGDPIPFDPSGIWPMQPNPSKDRIKQDSNCYTEAKAFHGAYRSLLRKLQDIFNGDMHGITGAIAIMKSLSAHGRKLMLTKGEPDSNDTTCGPIWDYDW